MAAARHSGPSGPVQAAVAGCRCPVSTANGTRCWRPCVTSTVAGAGGQVHDGPQPVGPGSRTGPDQVVRLGPDQDRRARLWCRRRRAVLSTRTRLGPGRAGATVTVNSRRRGAAAGCSGLPGCGTRRAPAAPRLRAYQSRTSASPLERACRARRSRRTPPPRTRAATVAAGRGAAAPRAGPA